MANFQGYPCKSLKELDDRFWSKIDIKGTDDCWNYIEGRDKAGYGKFGNGSTHRFAWSSFNKCQIPKGKWVLHKCDNRACCNPKHLYIGTHQDNMKDMVLRGRVPIRRSRLYAGEIWLIRRLKNIKAKDLGRYNSPSEFVAAMFKVCPWTILNIWKREKYICREGYSI